VGDVKKNGWTLKQKIKMNNKKKEKINEMDEKSQLKWLLSLRNKKKFTIMLDSNSTDIVYSEGDENDSIVIQLKTCLGNNSGIVILLEQLGFNADSF
jgi:hypothetical protein